MRTLLLAILLVSAPSLAHACITASEEATLEQMENLPQGYYGFEAEILSVTNKDGSAPDQKSVPRSQMLTVEAKIIQNFGPELPEEITLSIGPCGLLPEMSKHLYFMATKEDDADAYSIVDHPSYILYKAQQK